MENKQRDFKDVMLFAFACVIVILLMFKSCGRGEPRYIDKEKVVYKTVYKNERLDTVYIPRLLTKYIAGKAPKPFEKWDTLYLEQIKDVDTAQILEDYYSFYVYSDVIKHKYGRTFITDTISRNEIIGRQVTHDLLIPEVTKTITLTQPKRAALFVGGSILSNPKELAAGYNVNLSLKTKKDKMIEVGYNQLFSGQAYYSLGFKQKISFRK